MCPTRMTRALALFINCKYTLVAIIIIIMIVVIVLLYNMY